MKILAIDSSAVAGSVCLYEDGEIKAEYLTLDKRTHSETLLPLIDELKKETERQTHHYQRLYKRRKLIDSKGSIKSNWSTLMEMSALDG